MSIPSELLARLERMLEIPEGSLTTQADQLATHFHGAIGTCSWRRQVAERLHPPPDGERRHVLAHASMEHRPR
jgi:hypothetical protein